MATSAAATATSGPVLLGDLDELSQRQVRKRRLRQLGGNCEGRVEAGTDRLRERLSRRSLASDCAFSSATCVCLTPTSARSTSTPATMTGSLLGLRDAEQRLLIGEIGLRQVEEMLPVRDGKEHLDELGGRVRLRWRRSARAASTFRRYSLREDLIERAVVEGPLRADLCRVVGEVRNRGDSVLRQRFRRSCFVFEHVRQVPRLADTPPRAGACRWIRLAQAPPASRQSWHRASGQTIPSAEG